MYSIGEISKIVKISVDTLRYYDEIGLLKPIHIDQATRYRYYSEKQVNDMLHIMELKQYRFSLDAIKELVHCTEKIRLKKTFEAKLQQLSKELSEIQNSINLLVNRINEIESGDEIMKDNNQTNKTILLVDDSAFIKNVISDFLVGHGYKVVGQACNGNEGIDKYFQLKPDIVLMDINMPELDGIKAAKSIIDKDNDAKIIMCSALGFIPNILESLLLGACDFIVKPFQPEHITNSISKNLNERCLYNLNTVKTLFQDERFNVKTEEPLSRKSINELLNICKAEHNPTSPEVTDFFNSIVS